MLTVVISHLDIDRKVLFEAQRVEYQHEGVGAGLLIIHPAGDSTHLKHGKTEADNRNVFVMNSSGKTVGKYIL